MITKEAQLLFENFIYLELVLYWKNQDLDICLLDTGYNCSVKITLLFDQKFIENWKN